MLILLLHVQTTENNVFYMNKASKQSVWSLPDELKQWDADRRAQNSSGTASAKRKVSEDFDGANEQQTPAAEESAPTESKKPRKKKPKVVHSLQDIQATDADLARSVADQLKAEADREKNVDATEAAANEAIMKAKEHVVELTSDESKILFQAMLGEKDINPMAPWEMELPKFIADPRYSGKS